MTAHACFLIWKSQHIEKVNEAKLAKIAQNFAKTRILKRLMDRWKSHVRSGWKQAYEKSFRTRMDKQIEQIRQEYQEKLALVQYLF